MKLEPQIRHIITLIGRERDTDGWAIISEILWPVLHKLMPLELVIMEKTENGGRAKLTQEGESVFYAMQWL